MKWFLASFLALIALAIPAQEEVVRLVKMKRVGDWVGAWKLHGELVIPQQGSVIFNGKVTVQQVLGGTALEFNGEATPESSPDQPDLRQKKLSALGVLSFNDAASYADRKFNSFFSWSQDGRMLSLKGDFKGKDLILEGKSPNEEHFDLRVKAGSGDVRKIEVFATDGKREQRFLEFTLTREK